MGRKRFNAAPEREMPSFGDWVLDKGKELWPQDETDGEHLMAMVEELEEPYKSVIEMRVWGRMTFQAIAEEMGWPSRQWTWTYWVRGLERLRVKLATKGP